MLNVYLTLKFVSYIRDDSPFVYFILQNVNKQMTMSIKVKLYNVVKYITPPSPLFINYIPVTCYKSINPSRDPTCLLFVLS
jgi:hypothetical protein